MDREHTFQSTKKGVTDKRRHTSCQIDNDFYEGCLGYASVTKNHHSSRGQISNCIKKREIMSCQMSQSMNI